MWDYISTWIWLVLPVSAGIVSAVKGHYWWALVGILPAAVGGIAGAVEDGLGRPDWLSAVGGMVFFAILGSPLALVGAVMPATARSPLSRWSSRQKPRGTRTLLSRVVELGPVSSGLAMLAISAGLAWAVIWVTGLVDQRGYDEALVAQPVGETAVTDFQYSPNFNTGEVWTVTGQVEFVDGRGEVPPWRAGDPPLPTPEHPLIDHGQSGDLEIRPAYGVRLYFAEHPGLSGSHTITVTCRVQGHEQIEGSFALSRVLDACRNLEIVGE